MPAYFLPKSCDRQVGLLHHLYAVQRFGSHAFDKTELRARSFHRLQAIGYDDGSDKM